MQVVPPQADDAPKIIGRMDSAPRAVSILNQLCRSFHVFGVFVCLPLLTLLVFVDVGLRYFIKAPIPGSNEIAGVLLLLVLLFSLPLTTFEERHIKVDLCYELFGPGARRVADLVACSIGVLISIALAWHCFRVIPNELRYQEATLLLEIPLWPLTLATGLIAVLLVLLFVEKGARALFRRGL